MLQAIPQLQADQPEGQKAAQLGTAFGGGQAIGGQGVWAHPWVCQRVLHAETLSQAALITIENNLLSQFCEVQRIHSDAG